MKIQLKTGHITIDDNSDEAKKILDGKSYIVDKNGKLKVSNTDNTDSLYYLLKKIDDDDWIKVKPYLIKYLKKLI